MKETGLRSKSTRHAYSIIKQLRSEFKPRNHNIKDSQGRLLTDLQDILQRWKTYCQSLYSDVNNNDDSENEDDDENNNNNNHLGPAILLAEVRDAVRRLPHNKAAGYDNLPAELLKTGNEDVIQVLCNLCNEILRRTSWPSDWLKSLFVTIPKIPGTTNCDEHRTISLISHTSKVLLRILLKRSEAVAEAQFSENQAWGRDKRPDFQSPDCHGKGQRI